MIGIKATRRKVGKEEAEKPFWISFSDLMTALMVLFLVAMAVALIAVTHGLATIDAAGKERKADIATCIANVDALTSQSEFRGVSVRGNSIDFGTLVLFGNDRHTFESPAHEQFVRKFVPRVLDLARSEKCDKWLKRVVVEGFASQTGDYLYNLNLSYLRSQRVLCVLLDSKAADSITASDRKLVQTLFLVGGSSFNTAASEASQMRRVELKLEFRDLGSDKEKAADIPLDPGLKCPNDLR
jgi:outer membrane protein OmpA-like peptidoglycan-associated protein